jgi:hypothetical protein
VLLCGARRMGWQNAGVGDAVVVSALALQRLMPRRQLIRQRTGDACVAGGGVSGAGVSATGLCTGAGAGRGGGAEILSSMFVGLTDDRSKVGRPRVRPRCNSLAAGRTGSVGELIASSAAPAAIAGSRAVQSIALPAQHRAPR